MKKLLIAALAALAGFSIPAYSQECSTTPTLYMYHSANWIGCVSGLSPGLVLVQQYTYTDTNADVFYNRHAKNFLWGADSIFDQTVASTTGNVLSSTMGLNGPAWAVGKVGIGFNELQLTARSYIGIPSPISCPGNPGPFLHNLCPDNPLDEAGVAFRDPETQAELQSLSKLVNWTRLPRSAEGTTAETFLGELEFNDQTTNSDVQINETTGYMLMPSGCYLAFEPGDVIGSKIAQYSFASQEEIDAFEGGQ